MNHLIPTTLFYYLFVISGLITTGCGNSVNSVGELNLAENWQLQAFEGENVTFLEPDGDGLLIGTGEGLFHLNNGQFFNLGLNNYEMRGAVRLKGNDLLAAVRTPDFSSGDVTIFKRRDGRNSWDPFLNDYGGDDQFTFIFTLKPFNYKSDTLFAKASGGVISRSVNAGQSWSLITGRWDAFGGFGIFIKIDPFHSSHVWSGGTGPFLQPYLIKSSEFGDVDTWVAANIDSTEGIGAATSVYDVIIHSENENMILAGLDGSLIKSTNGGEEWIEIVNDIVIRTFSRRLSNPEMIYASGRDASTKLFFVSTINFGETWKKEIFEDGPSVVTTNDLEVLMIDDKEVLFLATDQGLYSFTFDK